MRENRKKEVNNEKQRTSSGTHKKRYVLRINVDPIKQKLQK
jgi:hypothetical protein